MGLMSPDCRSPVNVAVLDDAEASRVTIKNAFLCLEPVWLELCPGTVPRVLLSAAVARGTPIVGSEDCCEMGVISVSTIGQDMRRPLEKNNDNKSSYLPDSSGKMGDVVWVIAVVQDVSRPLEKGNTSKSRGLLDSNGRRPGKKARELYQALVISLQDMVKRDPSLSLESLPLPKCVLDNDKLRARLVSRVEAVRPAVW